MVSVRRLLVPFICFSFLMISCRPPQEATQYNITEQPVIPSLEDDGKPIDDSNGDGGSSSGNPGEQRYQGVEEFEQQKYAQVDSVEIVWVIDNSGSMKDEQDNLKNNFDSFIRNFVKDGQAKYPFKMGVTSTEAYLSGLNFFQGDNCFKDSKSCVPYDLTSIAAETNFNLFVDDFKTAVAQGVAGSGKEKSLYSAWIVSEMYKDWFSPDKSLLIYIPVSDEQEQSHLTADNKGPLLDENGKQYTLEKWVQKFQGLKENPALVRFFPIVRIKPIPGEDGDGDVGDRYLKLAELTGGKRYDIDKPFDGLLDDLGNSIVNLLKSFLLKSERKIVESTIEVRVNGVLSNDWVYQNKAIRFNTPPADGSIIKVTYEYLQ